MSGGRVIGMMRVKNEARWIGLSLASTASLVDGVVILDDGSTDATPDICRSFPHVVRYEYQREPVPDEFRDKNRLLRWCLELSPDWILVLDGDEALESRAPTVIRREIERWDPARGWSAFEARFVYFWDSPDRYIDDQTWHPFLFTVVGQDVERMRFEYATPASRLHCGRVPANVRGGTRKLDVWAKHYGYLDREDRRRKHRFYVQNDPARARDGYYDHLLRRRPRLTAWRERSLDDPVQVFGETDPHRPSTESRFMSSVRAMVPTHAVRPLRLLKYRLWG